MPTPCVRRRLDGASALAAALNAGDPVRVVLLRAHTPDVEAAAVAERARAAGARVHAVSARVLERFSRADGVREIAALVGPDPRAPLDEVAARGGAMWLLTGFRYPGNAGFAIRTAEVTGADGIAIDSRWGVAQRRAALRASMRADRLFPVLWADAASVLDAARRAGRRVIAIEDTGDRTPWESDLTRPSLLVVGEERCGIPPDVLARADEQVRLPTAGFIPSYKVQAALAAVATERLRQLGRADA